MKKSLPLPPLMQQYGLKMCDLVVMKDLGVCIAIVHLDGRYSNSYLGLCSFGVGGNQLFHCLGKDGYSMNAYVPTSFCVDGLVCNHFRLEDFQRDFIRMANAEEKEAFHARAPGLCIRGYSELDLHAAWYEAL